MNLTRFDQRPNTMTAEEWARIAEPVIDSYAGQLQSAIAAKERAEAERTVMCKVDTGNIFADTQIAQHKAPLVFAHRVAKLLDRDDSLSPAQLLEELKNTLARAEKAEGTLQYLRNLLVEMPKAPPGVSAECAALAVKRIDAALAERVEVES